MAKNRKYENVYEITFTGTTTNGFRAKFLHEVLTNTLKALSVYTNISYKTTKNVGDFKIEENRVSVLLKGYHENQL